MWDDDAQSVDGTALKDRNQLFGAGGSAHRKSGASEKRGRKPEAHERESAALTQRVQDQEVPERCRHADAGGDGVRVLPRRRGARSLDEGAHDRRAAAGLYRDEARQAVRAWGSPMPVPKRASKR